METLHFRASPLECFNVIFVDDVLSTAVHCVGLPVVAFIGFKTHRQFRGMEIHRGLKLLFYAAVLSSCIASICGICQNVLCVVMGVWWWWTTMVAFISAYALLLQCVLGMLLLHLFQTFRDSPFELPAPKRVALCFSFALMTAIWALQIVLLCHSVLVSEEHSLSLSVWALMLSATIIFVVLSLWTVLEFCHRLLLTAKSVSRWTQKSEVEAKQQPIINVSAKYLALFVVAMVSTVLNFGAFSLCALYRLDPTIALGLDCITNVICIFLQFSFSADIYYRYCRRLDACCRRAISQCLDSGEGSVRAKLSMLEIPRPSTIDEVHIAKNLEAARAAEAPNSDKTQKHSTAATASNDEGSASEGVVVTVISERALAEHIGRSRASSAASARSEGVDRLRFPVNPVAAINRSNELWSGNVNDLRSNPSPALDRLGYGFSSRNTSECTPKALEKDFSVVVTPQISVSTMSRQSTLNSSPRSTAFPLPPFPLPVVTLSESAAEELPDSAVRRSPSSHSALPGIGSGPRCLDGLGRESPTFQSWQSTRL